MSRFKHMIAFVVAAATVLLLAAPVSLADTGFTGMNLPSQSSSFDKKTDEQPAAAAPASATSLNDTATVATSTDLAEEEPLEIADPIKVKKIKLSASKLSLDGGETYSILAYASPAEATNQELSYESSNDSVASVSADGVITAWQRGKAKITVTATDGSNKKATCTVTVTSSPLLKQRSDGTIFVGADYVGNVFHLYTRLGRNEELAVEAYMNSLGSSKGERIVKRAAEYLGLSYDYCDCSSLVSRVYSFVGRSMSGTSAQQAKKCSGRQVSPDSVQPGDLLFFKNLPGEQCGCGAYCHRYMSIHHVGIYAGNVGGTRYVIDASTVIGKIVIRQWNLSENFAGMQLVFCAHP